MEMVGEARLEAAREVIWEALNDPAVLQASIPGCESLESTAANEFTATVVSKVGPIKARFAGKVSLSNIAPPRSYTLTGEGSGGAAGFARADIEVSLDALEPAVTLLRYGVKANVGGKLAQLGSRMIDAAARKSADDFFELFRKQVDGRSSDSASVRAAQPAGMHAFMQELSAPVAEVATMEAPGHAFAAAVAPAAANGKASTLEAAPAPTMPERAAATRDVPAQPAPVPRPVSPVPAAEAQAAVMDVLTSEKIKVWISDQVAVVTLNRPDSRNAMTYGMWLAMPSIMAALDRNPEVRAVILTGAGADFCAGADIAEFEKVRADVAHATTYEVAVDACCDAIANISKPTVAVLRGYCLGGGAHLAMSCDFRFAAQDAMMGIPATRLSIIYGVKGTRKLLSLVGLSEAKKILYGGQRFDAAHALGIGFVDQVAGLGAVASRQSFWERLIGAKQQVAKSDPMAEARAFATSLAGNAPLSMAGAKYLLNGMAMGTGALDLDRSEALIAAAAASDDYREGRAAFGEKRSPKFQGR
ncbi:enoyl-CoA hydratase/carnithine racemase [Paraburkholderia sp. GV068]|uniref:enoyl-CoA hydratase-related protein n=1 Tax=unclassified Paraburkholderia TaxID=2615204 RepID=UPI000D433EBB|nr:MULTISPECIES: enoyl-CoA hydratase-related protein [unclassified Paraburkholderia]PTQ93008.1 enoyl-CoA hydratase/carnithine racemase [Paraburkholderia sp. GV072]PUA99739.1 enoyl-CoA hydratase/carnithine racemase [Paraburkholderia sp. GV068]